MKNETASDLIAALDELLDLERTALVDGELERLGTLLPQKENSSSESINWIRLSVTPWSECRTR